MPHEDCPTCHQPIYDVRGAIADMSALRAENEHRRKVARELKVAVASALLALRKLEKDLAAVADETGEEAL